MTYAVTVTSQGQISIPAKLRHTLGFDRIRKAILTEDEGKIIIEPAGNFLELKGSIKSQKKITHKKTREGFINYLANRNHN
jgi:AbrB family looped-hinge helix DNA binding protein